MESVMQRCLRTPSYSNPSQKFSLRPISLLAILLFSILFFSTKTFAQWPGNAPVNPPADSFRIDGTLKANTAVGDWVQGTGTGGYVIQQVSGVWQPVNSSTTTFIRDDYNSTSDLIFSGSGFSDNPNNWKWTTGKATNKCDISTSMFHLTSSSNSKWIILGGDRYTTVGTSYIDFEFYQGVLTRNANGSFTSVAADGTSSLALTGGRTPGDFVLSMEYSNGGVNATVHYYKWENSGGWKYVEHAIPTIPHPYEPFGAVSAFGKTNGDSTDVPFGAFGTTKYIPFAFVEAAVNIDAILGGGCLGTGLNIKTVFVKTKASDSYNAALKDFVEPQAVSFHVGSESFHYSNDKFCKSEVTATPIYSGSGTFTAIAYGTATSPGLLFTDHNPISNNGVIDLVNSAVGSYIITYEFNTGGGCTGSQKDTITINANPTISSPAAVCVGSTITLSPTTGGTWSSSDNAKATVTNAGVVTGVAAGSVTFTFTVTGTGCSNTTSSVTVNAKPPAPTITITEPSLCGSATATLTVTNPIAGGIYTLTQESGGISPVIVTYSSGTLSFPGLIAGKGYNITVSSNGCSSSSASCIDPGLATPGSPINIDNVTESQTTVRAYPNPFSDKVKFVVTSSVGGKGSLDVYNMLGQKIKTVYQGFIAAGMQTFELSLPTQQIANLVYVLRVGDKKMSGKLLQINQ